MRNLFRPPSEAIVTSLESAMQAIFAATPLARNHERELPYAVADLSRLLTQDRSQLTQSYWINKRFLTAYCRYFLPWNLFRLSRLLPSLDLPVRENGIILDLGSGPLTVPLALWIAKPEWRALSLTFVCSDVSPAPLALGKEIFRNLASGSPWKVETVRAPMDKALGQFRQESMLITAGNVLNEVRPSREEPLESRLASLVSRIAQRLAPEGRFLSVEPGTRLGGKLLSLLRLTAFSAHMVPVTPCPHWNACPMLEPRASGWCHFTHSTAGAPKELAALSARAKLKKETASLACMVLRKATELEKARAARHMAALDGAGEEDWGDAFSDLEDDGGHYGVQEWATAYGRDSLPEGQFVRILSDPIRLPDDREAARYGCSARGLVLMKNALHLPSGSAVTVKWPVKDRRDAKSGALVLEAAIHKAPGGKAPGEKPPTHKAHDRPGGSARNGRSQHRDHRAPGGQKAPVNDHAGAKSGKSHTPSSGAKGRIGKNDSATGSKGREQHPSATRRKPDTTAPAGSKGRKPK